MINNTGRLGDTGKYRHRYPGTVIYEGTNMHVGWSIRIERNALGTRWYP